MYVSKPVFDTNAQGLKLKTVFHSYNLHLKLYTIEAVRNMFHEYVYDKAIEVEKMQMDFYSRTGIA